MRGNLRENRAHPGGSARRDKRPSFERSEIHAFGLQGSAERLGNFPLRVQWHGKGDERRSGSHRHQERKNPLLSRHEAQVKDEQSRIHAGLKKQANEGRITVSAFETRAAARPKENPL